MPQCNLYCSFSCQQSGIFCRIFEREFPALFWMYIWYLRTFLSRIPLKFQCLYFTLKNYCSFFIRRIFCNIVVDEMWKVVVCSWLWIKTEWWLCHKCWNMDEPSCCNIQNAVGDWCVLMFMSESASCLKAHYKLEYLGCLY